MEVYALTAKGKATLKEMRQSSGLTKTSSYRVFEYLNRIGDGNAGQIAGGTGLSVGEVVSTLRESVTGGLVRVLGKV
ncbi:hypothetical protein ACFLXE_02950 [Chloroflexota bacterium]